MRTDETGPGGRETAKAYRSSGGQPLNALNAVSNGRRGIRTGGRKAAQVISARQRALVHVARAALGLDEQAYRAALRASGGVESAAELTQEGMRALMGQFAALGFVPAGRATWPSAWSPPGGELAPRIGMATPAQLTYIRGLFAQWHGQADEQALARWIENRYHVSAVRFLDVVRAQKAIEGLKQMVARMSRAPEHQGEAK